MSDTVGVQIAPGALRHGLGARCARIIDEPDVVGAVAEVGRRAARGARPVARRASAGAAARRAARRAHRRPPPARRGDDARCDRAIDDAASSDAKQRKLRGRRAHRPADRGDRRRRRRPTTADVPFVSRHAASTRASRSPRSTSARSCATACGASAPRCSTSATIPPSLPAAVGLPAGRSTQLDVGSPFDYAAPRPAVLRPPPARPAHRRLPAGDARRAGRADHRRRRPHAGAVHQLEGDGRRRRGGRATASTSRSSPSATCRRPALVAEFADDEATCLFATAGFFQGVDVPGRTLQPGRRSTASRSPAPTTRCCRPAARRSAPTAFRADRPAARGDAARPGDRPADPHRRPTAASSPSSTAASARPATGWDIVNALPPMRRTRHRADAEAFLREITA